MRVTTLLRRLLRVTSLFVCGGRFEDGCLVIPVRPRWRRPRCSQCHRIAPGYDESPEPRCWTALPYGSMPLKLAYAMRRVDCPRCGVRVEHVPWAQAGSRFTRDFEEMVAYLAQVNDKTAVTRMMGIAWRTVGSIVERVVKERLEPGRLDGLRRIGIDEFSYRKRHRYVTVVVDHDRKRVVWSAKGRGAETLSAFFAKLGAQQLEKLETVTMDMAAGYLKAIKEHAPHLEVVFDRFHVQQLASRAVDKVRRMLWRERQGSDEGDAIKGSRYPLLKNPWNLERDEREKLRDLQRANSPLYRAYLLKETLAQVLDRKQPWRAKRELDEWLAWACRSRLGPFVTLARTIRKYRIGILAYIRERLTNGLVEGINNKLRTVARRSYGFHSPAPLIAMFHLCHGGIILNPPLP